MTNLSNVTLVLDIDGVIRDVAGSYRRALADTVEHFTDFAYRPTDEDIDLLKSEGIWNNDWEASQELIQRYFNQTDGSTEQLSYETIIKFFQDRYRGSDPTHWTGYICQEPLIATPTYFQALTDAGINWGFFSGATRASASYVLQRLGITSPILVAMEDAPGKPDPEGLVVVSDRLANLNNSEAQEQKRSVIYVGDTVADMLTVLKAREIAPDRQWIAIGVIPPHVSAENRPKYTEMMKSQGADWVLDSVIELTPEQIQQFLSTF